MAGRWGPGEEREGGGKPAFPRACEEGGHLYAALSLSARFVYVGIHIVIDKIGYCH